MKNTMKRPLFYQCIILTSLVALSATALAGPPPPGKPAHKELKAQGPPPQAMEGSKRHVSPEPASDKDEDEDKDKKEKAKPKEKLGDDDSEDKKDKSKDKFGKKSKDKSKGKKRELREARHHARVERKEALQGYRKARATLLAAGGDEPASSLTPEQKEERKKAQKLLLEARKDLRAVQRTINKKRRKQLTPEQRAEFESRLKKVQDDRKATRQERGKKTRAALKTQLGTTKLTPSLREELKRHAWRMARLDRLNQLAEASENKRLGDRIENLQKKEFARHQKHVDLLKKPQSKDSGLKKSATAPEDAQKGAAE